MSELRAILSAARELEERGMPMALATIVAVRGSTYRRPGARLLVPASGEPIGTLSGGCFEGEVARTGREVLGDGRSRLVAFDATADGDEVWGLGLGCNGAMEVLVEAGEAVRRVLPLLESGLAGAAPVALVTLLSDPLGARLAMDASRRRWSDLPPPLTESAQSAASAALERGRSSLVELRPESRAFVEVIGPPIRLVVCGAGHDAVPLVGDARALGWRVLVTDVRRRLLSHARFGPEVRFADAAPPDLAAHLEPSVRDFVVVMSHNYLRDLEYVRAVMGTPVRYIGVLGPRARTQRILAELEERGVGLSPADRLKLHAPAGLDIGAEEPTEVARSIVAEILAVDRGRAGGMLRAGEGPIHPRSRGYPPM
ncbi:MAG: XdhC family protein [Candidatus Limnocylindria bacterium]